MSECVENTHRVNSVLRLAYTRKMRIIMNTKTMTIEEDSNSKLAETEICIKRGSNIDISGLTAKLNITAGKGKQLQKV